MQVAVGTHGRHADMPAVHSGARLHAMSALEHENDGCLAAVSQPGSSCCQSPRARAAGTVAGRRRELGTTRRRGQARAAALTMWKSRWPLRSQPQMVQVLVGPPWGGRPGWGACGAAGACRAAAAATVGFIQPLAALGAGGRCGRGRAGARDRGGVGRGGAGLGKGAKSLEFAREIGGLLGQRSKAAPTPK